VEALDETGLLKKGVRSIHLVAHVHGTRGTHSPVVTVLTEAAPNLSTLGLLVVLQLNLVCIEYEK
jgi:hypothetical protein